VVDLDGWDTGNAPLTGDFFSDYDSIVYAFNGQNYVQNKLSSGYPTTIVTIPTDLSTASILRALTTAVVDQALSIQQWIELDPSATYFKTTITLQNVSADTLNDVRVMRGFFAQQDLPTYDSYYTFNDVLSNPTSGNDLAIVQALGRYSGVSVNLVAFDSAARASTFGDYYRTNAYDPSAWDTPLDLNGQLNDQAGSTNTNITLNTKFGDLAAGQSITKEYYISFNGHGNGNDMCIGTEGADNINAGAGNDILLGLAGNDILTGGAGNDRFVFTHGAGADTITDFVAGAGTDDVIELRDMGIASFTDVMSHATQSGANVVLDLSFGDLITLNNVTIAQLHADDFMFA
jgi:Ca2+-binding RTX toxin-like protein